MQILEHAHRRPECGEHVEDRAEDAVAVSSRVAERVERCRQLCGQLRDERVERSCNRAELTLRCDCRETPERLDHGPERQRLAKRMAAADDDAAVGDLRPTEELSYEARLTDPGLALHQHNSRR